MRPLSTRCSRWMVMLPSKGGGRWLALEQRADAMARGWHSAGTGTPETNRPTENSVGLTCAVPPSCVEAGHGRRRSRSTVPTSRRHRPVARPVELLFEFLQRLRQGADVVRTPLPRGVVRLGGAVLRARRTLWDGHVPCSSRNNVSGFSESLFSLSSLDSHIAPTSTFARAFRRSAQ